MSYYARALLAALTLLLLLGLVIWRGPQVRDVTLLARSPSGASVATGVSVRMTFSRPVDRPSIEQSFALAPAVDGRFFWDSQTLTFVPNRRLASDTDYRVTVGAVRDQQGRLNQEALSWSFRTRSPQLLLVEGAPATAAVLRVADRDGQNVRTVHTEPGGIGGMSLSPDASQLLYVTARAPQRMALVLLHLENGSVRPLVDDTAASASAPAWSPLGDMIAYERRAIQQRRIERPQIWLAQPDGTSLGPLYGEQIAGFAPVWSPAGQQLAFLNGISQTVELFSFAAGRRSFPDHNDEPVSWAPDGNALVYASPVREDGGAGTRIRRVDLEPNTTRDLTDGATADLNPVWSPDGTAVVFTRREQTADGGSTLWLIEADGGRPRQVTASGPYRDVQPVWSPDSRQIAFIRSSLDAAVPDSARIVDSAGGAARLLRDNVTRVMWLP